MKMFPVRRCAVLVLAMVLSACGDDDAAGDERSADTADAAESGADGSATTSGDAGVPGTDGSGSGTDTAEEEEAATGYAACYPEFVEFLGIDIDALGLPVGEHCAGSAQQDFEGIERVVFLGDSISAGVGAPAGQGYRDILSERLRERYPGIVVDDCSRGGSVVADLLGAQIPQCFPEAEERRTLVVFTSGGNDVVGLAFSKATVEEAQPDVDRIVGRLRETLAWLQDPANVPGGVRVVYANVYEFTDATGLLDGCRLLAASGLSGTWLDGLEVYARLETGYAQAAVDAGTDVMFLEELFCGHGFNRDDPTGPCYERRGELWLSNDCIHPNATGHAQIADAFWAIIGG
jgi:hypothetical protein